MSTVNKKRKHVDDKFPTDKRSPESTSAEKLKNRQGHGSVVRSLWVLDQEKNIAKVANGH